MPDSAKRAQLLELSRRVTALGRLTAGVAHEVKNPLNAMTIHLELLKQKLAAGAGADGRPKRTSTSSAAKSGGWTTSCRDS